MPHSETDPSSSQPPPPLEYQPAPPHFTNSPDARSKSITAIEGADTFGVLNRHAAKNQAYQVGIAYDKGSRRTMEDAHSFIVDFAGVRGQGFFAVFDGHAGKHAAEWCGQHFHECLLSCMHETPDLEMPDILNNSFHRVDENLSRMCEESEGKIHSGCTAVTAFLRVEDSDSKQQSFLSSSTAESPRVESPVDSALSSTAVATADSASLDSGSAKIDPKKDKKVSSRSRIKNAFKSIGGSRDSGSASPTTPRSASPQSAADVKVVTPPSGTRRVLYSANAGDARGVLCRKGAAVRLTYDHKGSDKQEAKRITDAGGFVMSGRVNGVLAVTRSLGDSSMKEFVVGSPYTTETELCDDDEFLILACDGLWDVATDQAAVDLIYGCTDAQTAANKLLKHALDNHSTDNVTVLVVRFKSGSSSSA